MVVGGVKKYFLITTTRAKHIWQLMLIKMLGGGWVGVSYGTQTPWKPYIQIMWKLRKRTSILWKTYCEGRLLDFLFKQIFLIEEQDDGGVSEPLVVTNGVKKLQALLHSVLKQYRHINTSATECHMVYATVGPIP